MAWATFAFASWGIVCNADSDSDSDSDTDWDSGARRLIKTEIHKGRQPATSA